MKKLISILISLSILLSLCAPSYAWANESVEIENPFYARSGLTSRLKGGNIVFIEESDTAEYGGKTYYSRGMGLYLYAKKLIDKREEEFNLYVLSKDALNLSSAANNITQMVFLGATDDEFSQTSTDGDYIRWAIKSYETKTIKKDAKADGYYYYTIAVEFNYYDTKAEEEEADAVINGFIDSLDTSGMTDFDIVKAVHDYLCGKNTYDYKAAADPYKHLYAFSAYGALVKGKCVCQGYAAAFYRICRELGYGVRFVSSDPNWGCHAWNIISLDGKYYIVDCTWDDQAFDEDDSEIPKYFYFLTDYQNSQAYDSVYSEHKLYPSMYETNYFEKKYKDYFADEYYTASDVKRLSSCKISLAATEYTYSGKKFTPKVTVTDSSGTELKAGTDYTVKYSSNLNAGLARVDITGAGDYADTSSHRLFTITPPQTVKPQVTEITQTKVQLSWSAVQGGVSGYAVQEYSDGKWQTVKSTSSTSCKISSLLPASKKKYRVKAYKTVYRRRIYGANGSAVICCTKPEQCVIKSVTAGRRKLTVKWKKARGTGYQLQYSANKSFKGKKTVKIKSVKTLKRTVKKLKAKKKYYFRIRAYKNYTNENGVRITKYGKWSAKKSAKTE